MKVVEQLTAEEWKRELARLKRAAALRKLNEEERKNVWGFRPQAAADLKATIAFFSACFSALALLQRDEQKNLMRAFRID